MRLLCKHELHLVCGGYGWTDGDPNCPYCNGEADKINQFQQELTEARQTFDSGPRWGGTLAGIAAAPYGRAAIIGATLLGHAVESYSKPYNTYRSIAQPYEQEYSGGLP